jgi:hypothetical protein
MASARRGLLVVQFCKLRPLWMAAGWKVIEVGETGEWGSDGRKERGQWLDEVLSMKSRFDLWMCRY